MAELPIATGRKIVGAGAPVVSTEVADKPKRFDDTLQSKLLKGLEAIEKRVPITKKGKELIRFEGKKGEAARDFKTLIGQGLSAVGEIAGEVQKKALTPKGLEKFFPTKSPFQIFKERSAFVAEERELRKSELLMRPKIEAKVFDATGELDGKKLKHMVNNAIAHNLLNDGIFTSRPNGFGATYANFISRGASYGIFNGYASEATEMARTMRNPYNATEKVAATAGALTGGLVTYGAVAQRVGAAMKTIPSINKFAASHPFLFGASIQNLGEEAIDFSVRQGTGQTYTKFDFMLGMGFGASAELLFGSLKALKQINLPKVTKQLNNEVEIFQRETGRFPDMEKELWPRLETKQMAGSKLTYGEAYSAYRGFGEKRLAFLSGIDETGKPREGGFRFEPEEKLDIDDTRFVMRSDGQPQRITNKEVMRLIKGEPAPFKKQRETTLLKNRLKSEARGARRSFLTTKRTIKEVQKDAVDYIKTMLPTKERGRLLSALKNVQDQKGLRRIIDQANGVVENMNRRDWVADIKSVGQKKFLDKLPIDTREAIRNELEPYALTKSTQKTKDLAAQIERQLELGTEGIDPKLIAKTELVKKPALADLDSAELRGILDRVNQIAENGQVTRKLEKIDTESRVLETVQDLEKSMEWWTSKRGKTRNKFLETIWFGDLEYTTPDRFFDMLDGFKGYKGDMYKTFKQPVDAKYSEFLTEFEDVFTKANDILVKNDLSKESLDRIGQFGLWQRVDGGKFIGREKLELRGIFDEPQLTAKEMEMYNFMRGTYDEMFPRIKETLAKSENREIKGVDNYWPMMTDRTAKRVNADGIEEEFVMSTKEAMASNSFNLSRDAEAGFTVQAVGGQQGVELNAAKVFLTHMEDSIYFTKMQPVLDNLKKIVDFRAPAGLDNAGELVMQKALGRTGAQYVNRYLATVAKNGASQGVSSNWTQGMRVLRNNTSLAVMGGNASVTIKQPLAAFNAAPYVGPHHLLRSMERVGAIPGRKLPFKAVNKNIQFILENSAEIRARQSAAGEFALYELSREGNWIDKIPVLGTGFKIPGTNKKMPGITKVAFYPLQKLDSMTAMAAWDAAYRNGVRKNLPHAEAVMDADRIVRLTQASGLSKDIPFVIQRGETARFVHQFQSFFINDWNLIKHDIVQAGLLRGVSPNSKSANMQRRLQAVSASFFMLQAAMLEDYISSGYDWDKAQEGGLIPKMAGKVPVVGRAIGFQKFGGTTVPGLDAPLRAAGGVIQALDPEASERVRGTALVNVGAGVGSVAGVPFSGQFFKKVRKQRREQREAKSDFSDVDFSDFSL